MREDMNRRFDTVDQKFDKMVTRDLFDATVLRLDGQDKTIETKMDSGFESIKSDMKSGFQGVEAGQEKRTNRSRWLIGIAISVAAIVVTVGGILAASAFNLANILLK